MGMLNTHEDGPVLRSAFPMSLHSDVDAGLSVMPLAEHRTMPTGRQVRIGSEEISILGRIYHREPSQGLSDLTQLQKRIVSSLYTRHHDGFVRERHVGQILEADHPWIPVFVLQLLGEYVIQIGQTIANRVATLPQETYRTFAHANPDYMSALRSRIVSYWSEYYRGTPLSTYAGYRALEELGLWKGPEGKRILTRAVAKFDPDDEPAERT
jgi:hypothetical protein